MQSRDLAGIVGPTLCVMNVSELLHLRIWAVNQPQLTYLNGMLLFLGGLSIVRVHNRWGRGWPLLITLLGWGAVAAGLFRIFFPEAQQGGANAPTYTVIALLFLAGLFLSYQGYRRQRKRQGPDSPDLPA